MGPLGSVPQRYILYLCIGQMGSKTKSINQSICDLTGERSEPVRYQVGHEKIKFVPTSGQIIK